MGPAGPAGPGALYAVVSSTGAIVRQNGVLSVVRMAAGHYVVTFNRAVSSCALSATINPPTTAAPGNLGSVHPIGTSATAVTVYTYPRTSNTLTDRWFTLSVFCAS